jgi:hypothetical protein
MGNTANSIRHAAKQHGRSATDEKPCELQQNIAPRSRAARKMTPGPDELTAGAS